MGSDWHEYKIGDLGRVVTGKTPSTKIPKYFGGQYPFITIPDMGTSVYISETARTLSQAGAEVMRSCQLPKGSVMMSCIATIGKCGITTKDSFTNQQINSVICDHNKVHPLYLYYVFTQLGFELDAAGGGGSVYTNVSKSRFSDISVIIPPLPDQRAIAHILGSLDDKIELNRRMNQTLEAMARAIFKSWFVDFDPVHAKAEGRPTGLPDDIAALFPDSFEDSELGEIPTGWKVVTFEELIDAKQGMYIPKNNMTELPSSEYPYPVWGGNGIRGYAATFMYKEPVVVLTCRGSNCGRIDLTESPAWISNIAFACSPKCGSVNFINVYLAYSSLTDTITGSAQPQITYTSLRNKRMQFPVHKEVCDAYSDYIDRLYDVIRGNNRQSTTLASLRDTLLPKLISGELRVPDAEKFVEEAGL